MKKAKEQIDPRSLLNNLHHQFENYVQRMTVADWRKILLAKEEHVIFEGNPRTLVGKSIGFGVVEVSKKPLEIA